MAARNGDLPADEYYASTRGRYGSLLAGCLNIFTAAMITRGPVPAARS